MRNIHDVPAVSEIPLMRGGARGRTQFATYQAQRRTYTLMLLMGTFDGCYMSMRSFPRKRQPAVQAMRKEVAAMAREFRKNGWPFPRAKDASLIRRGNVVSG